MEIFDIVILAVLGLGAVIGFLKGIVKPLFRLIEIIVTFGLGVLAVVCVCEFGLASPESKEITNLAIIAGSFLVMFIISMIIGDYLFNKFKYKKHKFKNVMIDRTIGLVIGLVVSAAIVWMIFALMTALEGSEYEFNNIALLAKSKVACFFYDYNPFGFLESVFVNAGLNEILVDVINGLIPNHIPFA
ncbi:MAG: CvpA family protein [Clostridia bacterium]|nr:CvpA family protein [Clostridia bacterium]